MRRGWLLVAGVALACGGSYDVDAVEQVLSAVEQADPLQAKDMLAVGLLDPSVGVVSASCSDAWDGFAIVDPEQKSSMVIRGIDGMMPACPMACSTEAMQAMAVADSNARMQIIADGCDAATMFADPRLDSLRMRFDVTDWLVIQAVTEPIMQNGGPQADRLKALAPSVAVGMVGLPYVNLDEIAPGSLTVTALPSTLAATELVAPQADALRACLGGEPSGYVRVVLDVDGKLARVLSIGDPSCYLGVASGIAWPSGSAAVIDVTFAK